MAQIPNKLLYFSQGSSYRTKREDEEIRDDSIVFVEDDASIVARQNIFGVRGVYPGTCTTAAGTAAKVATTSPLFPLDSSGKPMSGTTIAIKYSNTNSYKTAGTTMTLNVNSTGAYPIYYNDAEVVSTTLANTIACGYKDRYTYYIFNGTQWVWLSYGTDTNTTYSNASLGQGYAIQNNESESDTVTATLSSYALTTGGIVAVKFTTDIGITNPSLNINSTGSKPIYYRGSTLLRGTVNAGDTVTFIYDGTYYHIISIDKDIPDPATTAPIMDGTAAVGSSTKYAKEDHVHPSDTSKANVADLATVATSGSYNDLTDKPTIPTSSDINAIKPLIVNIAQNGSGSNITYSADTTVADINSAVKAGRTVVAKINGSYYQLHYCNEVSENEIEGNFFAGTAVNTPDIIYTLSFYSYRETTSDPWEDSWEFNILEEVTPDWNITNQYTRGYIKNKPVIPNSIKVGSVAGKLYRNDVNGGGNFTVKGNSGCIPNLTAGTFLVSIYAKSTTQSYTFKFNFGSVSYNLSTTNGEINDVREITIPSDGTFSGSVLNGSIASGTILYVVMYNYLTPVSTVGIAAVTNRYSDLDGTPTIPTVPTNISSFTNDVGYITSTAITDLTDIL